MQTRREKSRLGRPLSACSGTGVFVGYASLFGARDGTGDVVLPGAFRDSLMRRGADGIRMLFQHNPAEPIGTWLEMRENAKGLYVRGRLDCNVQRGRELLSLLESGGLDGLSIGFKTVTAVRDRASGTRRLHRVDLWEISLVTFPMLPGARVSAVTPARAAAEQLFAARAAKAPRPDPEASPSLASLLRSGALQFQQGAN
ncbi:MAG: HK97 family phage prohead protease [Rhizobiales bacterium]|nr:HK97 family phage prohead protease [Hyphomicrobiales bacterium]MBI3672367.1 HK97 family phage prohead protease [Hyphomicrobiales bacterium]